MEAALCRVWADKVNRECCSPYYAVLVRKDPKEQKHAMESLISGLRSYSRQLEKTSGPLFLADAQVGTEQHPAPSYYRARMLHSETAAWTWRGGLRVSAAVFGGRCAAAVGVPLLRV